MDMDEMRRMLRRGGGFGGGVSRNPNPNPTMNSAPPNFNPFNPMGPPIPIPMPPNHRLRFQSSSSPTNPHPHFPPTQGFQVTPTALPPQPPNWDHSCDLALQAMTPFKKIRVQPTSDEYKVISELIPSGTQISQIERVVNLELWKKFLVTRKELLCAKSRDLELCKALGMSERELHQKAHIAMNFDPPAGIPAYSDNVALLWHCTKGNNVDAILSQGLDDRLAHGGSYGRGIYFADDPLKSMQYDRQGVLFLFAVYLGDCCVHSGGNALVREPEKQPCQKRNQCDLFFDSIVGGGSRNEFVIFNRTQCCPLYVVSYGNRGVGFNSPRPRPHQPSRSRGGHPTLERFDSSFQSRSNLYIEARTRPPPFVWGPHSYGHHSNGNPRSSDAHWPFFAHTIFDLMKKKEPRPSPSPSPSPSPNSFDSSTSTATGAQGLGQGAHGFTKPSRPGNDEDDEFMAIQLTNLCDLGFYDLEENKKLLKRFGCNLEKTIDYLVQRQPESTSTMGPPEEYEIETSNWESGERPKDNSREEAIDESLNSFTPVPPRRHSKTKNIPSPSKPITPRTAAANAAFSRAARTHEIPMSPNPEKEDCPICCTEYSDPSDWKQLNCDHKLCTNCYGNIEKKGTRMCGKAETFVKCPFCQTCSVGEEIGSCPNGRMDVRNSPAPCPGYEGYSTLVINYSVAHPKYRLNRTAYLPNTPEGNRILNLLRIAWDRRLIFSIGNSLGSGRQDVLVWNIHHKTSVNGGVQRYGYPDPTYFQRVLAELKQYGIQ